MGQLTIYSGNTSESVVRPANYGNSAAKDNSYTWENVSDVVTLSKAAQE